MPTTRGAAKDPKDTQDVSGGASESNFSTDAEIDGPYDDGNGNFKGHTEDGDDGTMVAVTTVDDSLAKTMDDSLAKMAAARSSSQRQARAAAPCLALCLWRWPSRPNLAPPLRGWSP